MMKVEMTANEFDLVRSIVANRLDGLMDKATNPNADSGDREIALEHAGRVGVALIALDEAKVIEKTKAA